MKKAFTLVELLAVIIILGVIGLIVTPIISSTIKNNKEKLYQAQLQEIEEAASKWAYANLGSLPTEESGKITITLDDLKRSGDIPLDIRNPKTGDLLENEMTITITYKNNKFVYYVEGKDDHQDQTNGNAPVMSLNGNFIEYIEIGMPYQDMGVSALDKDGKEITNVSIQYKLADKEVSTIDTSKFATYTVIYVATSTVDGQAYTSRIVRTVIVRDTTPPVLTIPGDVEISINEAKTFNLLSGVTATDNSGETINVTTTGYDTLFGKKFVTYTAIDSSGNKTEKKRLINIVSNGGSPTANFLIQGSPMNSNGWAKANFYVKAEPVDQSGIGIRSAKWCVTQGQSCEPTTELTNNNILISTESSSNRICVKAMDRTGKEGTTCSNTYSLDRTAPQFSGIGDITVALNLAFDLTKNVTVSDSLSGFSGIDEGESGGISLNYTYTPTSIETSSLGTKIVTYTATDVAGNTQTVARNIIVSNDPPAITFTVQGSPINSNGWARSNFYVNVNVKDNSSLGIRETKWCTSTTGTCTPSSTLTSAILISTESNNNRICAQSTDNNGKTSSIICSDTYKLDKTLPTVGNLLINGSTANTGWYSSNLTLTTSNGSDGLSGHSSTTSNISSITSNTSGTTATITTTDLAGNSSSRTYTVKLDKNNPTLSLKSSTTDTTLEKSDIASSSYFNIGYGISGGNVSCNPENIKTLSSGNKTITCTVTGGNGLKANLSKSITIQPINKDFVSTGSIQTYTIPSNGTYRITAIGAAGTSGNMYGYSGATPTGGKGAKLQADFNLKAGDEIIVVVGAVGSVTASSAKDGTSGAGGGGTFIFKKISSITDSRYQFTKSGINYEVLLVAAGGGGTNDSAYQNTSTNGKDGVGNTWYSPSNHISYSTTSGSNVNGVTMGITQFINNNSIGGNYTRSGVCTGGFGAGSCSDDSASYGGGWSGSNYESYSYSTGINTSGVTGYSETNGSAIISTQTLENNFSFTGNIQTFIVPVTANYKIEALAASGTSGNLYGFTGTAPVGGKGAKIGGEFTLNAGDEITIVVGGVGSITQPTAKDGMSGAGGGGTFVYKKISSITDSRYQFTKGGINYEVLLVAAGGGGTNDTGFQGTAKNGIDGVGNTWYSPTNHVNRSTTTTNGTTSTSLTAVLGINQFISYNSVGGYYLRNSGTCRGGFGGGGCADDNQSYGGGWYGTSYITYSYSTGTNTSGVTGANEGNGSVTITTLEPPVNTFSSQNFEYTGSVQEFVVPATGNYKLEVWGAQGGSGTKVSVAGSPIGGKGGYSSGQLRLIEGTTLYIMIGENPKTVAAAFNGGGGTNSNSNDVGGGGATDIRINSNSLYSRVIVAGGGGGVATNSYGGFGGGIIGQDGNISSGTNKASGGTQTSGGTAGLGGGGTGVTSGIFGIGGIGSGNSGGGGGGGWYGGGGGGFYAGGGGGSGYVYTSSTASSCPSGCLLNSSYYLTNAEIIAGNSSIPNPNGSGTIIGNSDNGFARITFIN